MNTNLSKHEKPKAIKTLKTLKPIPLKCDPWKKTEFIKVGGIEIY